MKKCLQCGVTSEELEREKVCPECQWTPGGAASANEVEITGRDSEGNPRVVRVVCREDSGYVTVAIGPANSRNSRASIRLTAMGTAQLSVQLKEAYDRVFV